VPATPVIVVEQALVQLPPQLRQDLLGSFTEIVNNFAENRWEPSELNGGKLCEAAYSICKGLCSGSLPQRAQKPRNMLQACQALERDYAQADRSPRIQIPRMVVALYEIRNNRGVGHLGGDVDPNHMDAVAVLQMSKWIVAELVRIMHGMSTEDASDLVDALVEREVPLVWRVGQVRRVLDQRLSMRDKTLVLLHSIPGAAAEADLVAWVEHSNPSVYRRDVLRRAHRDRLLEYDATARTAQISPLGIAYVEDRVLRNGGNARRGQLGGARNAIKARRS
jgi:hypothetical protein